MAIERASAAPTFVAVAAWRHGPRLEGFWLACAFLALLAWDASGLDLWAMRDLGGRAGFPWRRAWGTAHLVHEGGRWLAMLLFAVTAAVACRPFGPWRRIGRPQRWGTLGAVAVALALIPLMKQASLSSCPWDLREFGGHAAYVSHWRWGVGDGGTGHCFPAGHPSSAFAFLPLAFSVRKLRPSWATGLTLALVGLGAVYGVSQTLRGAHYPSHTLWTAWLCWAWSLASLRWIERA